MLEVFGCKIVPKRNRWKYGKPSKTMIPSSKSMVWRFRLYQQIKENCFGNPDTMFDDLFKDFGSILRSVWTLKSSQKGIKIDIDFWYVSKRVPRGFMQSWGGGSQIKGYLVAYAGPGVLSTFSWIVSFSSRRDANLADHCETWPLEKWISFTFPNGFRIRKR